MHEVMLIFVREGVMSESLLWQITSMVITPQCYHNI